jgi:hypothetical protein
VSNNVSNFYIKEWFNSSHDVTWSFQYNLSGNNKTDGGFTTFLALSSPQRQNNVGGGGASLGIGPKGIINKINGTIFCVAIDSTGLFGTKNTFSTGNTTPIPNSMIIRINNDLQFLTAFPLSLVGLSGLNTQNIYNTIRINYTNVGQTINIQKLNENDEYETFYTYTGQFEKETSSPVRIGFSHTSPILPTNIKSKLTLKDIHTQGRYVYPKYHLLYERIYDKDGNLIAILDENGNLISDELFQLILNNPDSIDDILNKEALDNLMEDDTDLLEAETDSYLKISPENLNVNLSKESKLDGSLTINFEKSNKVIDIIIHPQTKYVINNSEVSVKVLAESAKKLSYQWYSNGVKVLNQTSNTYTIPQITSNRLVYCEVSTLDGDKEISETALLTVADRPIIYQHPKSEYVANNSSITLSVSAKITAPLTYDWYVNDVLIPNNNYYKYRLKNIVSDKNVYCIIKNIAGTSRSNTANIKIATAPQIVTQPSSLIVGKNKNVTYSLSATGTEPLNYKWYVNNIPVLNLNNKNYSFNSGDTIRSTKPKSIYCVVSNIAGSVTSNKVNFNVVNGPIILTQPTNLIVKSGTSSSFTVSAIGDAELSYQWFEYNSLISGETLSSYTIQNPTTNKSIYCKVKDSTGETNTDNVSLIIEQLPIITSQPITDYVIINSNATFTISATSLTPIYYKWFIDDVEDLINTSNSLTIENITQNKTVYCKLSNLAGEIQSQTVSASLATPPTITNQPISLDLDQYTNALFEVYVDGTPPFNYQWYAENLILNNQTLSSYTLTNLSYDIDDIYCVITNSVSTITSNKVYARIFREPNILAVTQNLTADAGTSVSVAVTAIGGQPFTYQWYSENNLINGATLSSYTISNLMSSVMLSCIVSNRVGSVSSDVIDIYAIKQPSYALQFRSSNNTYLSRTPTIAGNRRIWTWSGWINRRTINTGDSIFHWGSTQNDFVSIAFANTNILACQNAAGNVVTDQLQTTQTFTDTSKWYHIVVACDTTQTFDTNRIKIYVDGAQITSFSIATYPAINFETYVNSTEPVFIGKNSTSGIQLFDGALAEINFIDGQALAASNFGQTKSGGTWFPKTYTGTYGTNGFYLNFANQSGLTNTTIGDDASSNNNQWNPNNFSSTDALTVFLPY